MTFNRRNFIRSAALLATFPLSELDAFAARGNLNRHAPPVAEDDETYWRNVRQMFPINKGLTYLNNATMGPSPYPVIEAVHAGMVLTDHDCNYGGWEATSAKIAGLVGASPGEIALTHNVTEGVNIMCWGLPLRKGDEVIMTTHEHVGGAFPWLNRQKLHGIVLKVFTPAATAAETLTQIASLITKKTKVIAIPHIPCTQGQILPLQQICQLAKEKGIYTLIDGAHGPGMLPLDLHELGCDAYASCCHKWMLGPKGTGFLYVREDFQPLLQAYFVGAGGDDGKWNMAATPIEMGAYAPDAHRYYSGTQAASLFKGVDAAVDFIETIGIDNIHKRVKALGNYTYNELMAFGDKVEVITPAEPESRCAVIGFRVKGVDSNKFYTYCLENSVRIRYVAENGLRSLRVSTHIYNNKQEVDKLMELISDMT
ncbi:MAG TPA: aminotransferase class V-fold PLP-dependent enzyme [Flavipsychrobacter sp.]